MNASKFPVVSYQSRCVATPEHSLPGYSENYDRVVAFAPGCGEHPFMVYQDPSTHSTTIELSRFPSLTTMLRGYCQPCGGHGALSKSEPVAAEPVAAEPVAAEPVADHT